MTKTRLFLLLSLGVVIVAYFWPRPQFSPSMVAGKRVLVTGASSGIGEQLAYQYARAGASVFITARRAALLEKVVENCKSIGSQGAQFGSVPADMSDMKQTTNVIQAAVEQLGGLDQIVLNHAYVPKAIVFDDTEESYDGLKKAIDVNMRSYVHLAMQSLPYLKESNGSIGVVNSLAGKYGLPLLTSYSASKFALDGFYSGLRHELRRFNVSITIAVLGGIDTNLLHSVNDFVQKTYKKAQSMESVGFKPASAEDCAYEIMRGTTMREREIYFPEGQFIRYLVFFRELIVRLDSEDIGMSSYLNELLND